MTRRNRRLFEFVSQEDIISLQFTDSLSMISDNSNEARTDETNEADGEHNNVKEEHTTAPMVRIEKKVPLTLHRLKDFNAQVTN